jgi:hypothetical protein
MRGFLCLLLVSAVWLGVLGSPKLLEKSKVVYALNCGSTKAVLSEHGFEYQPVSAG